MAKPYISNATREGFQNAFDLSPTFDRKSISLNPQLSDAYSIAKDWRNVGHGIIEAENISTKVKKY
jgi:hypothetical protein